MQPATGAAHTFRRATDGAKHFVRVSRSTIKARNGLLKDLLVRKGAMEPWDRRPCQGATVDDVNLPFATTVHSRCVFLFFEIPRKDQSYRLRRPS